MRVVVSKFGKVEDEIIHYIVELMEECYSRLSNYQLELVDLYVFERSSSLEAFMMSESYEVGVESAQFDDSFFAMHDAWRGTPRITLCVERMNVLPRLVKEGGIRHEVGHSILHGDLRYYLLPIPPAFLELEDCFRLTKEYVRDLLYLISMAVKDYEVSRLLTEKGYVEDQLAYAKHLLTVSEDDRFTWRISRGKPLAETLCLVSCLKALSCVVPFITDERFTGEVERSLREGLSYLPKKHAANLLDIVTYSFPSLEMDTLSNINHVANLTAERLVKPILLREEG